VSTERKAGHSSPEKPGTPLREQPSPQVGRPKLFQSPTVRLNLHIPEGTAKSIRHLAIEQGISPSQLIDAWARKAEMDDAIARGLKAIVEGRTVSQEEAERRLSRWG
jgi:predicted transcriptional regulator